MFSSTGLGVEDETIVDFGLEWMDKLADEPSESEDMEDNEHDKCMMHHHEEGAEMDEDVDDPMQGLTELLELGEFMDLIKTFLAGGISDN